MRHMVEFTPEAYEKLRAEGKQLELEYTQAFIGKSYEELMGVYAILRDRAAAIFVANAKERSVPHRNPE